MKLRVIRDTNSEYLTSIDAEAGMLLKDGRAIAKANSKSIVVTGVDGESEGAKLLEAAVWYSDAVEGNYGIEKVEGHELEMQAAKARKFAEGEWWYNHRGDFVSLHTLQNPCVRAGWEFAKSTSVLRNLILKGL